MADNDDMLKFTACVRRKNTEPEQLNATAKIEVKLDPEDPEYELRTEPADQPGKIREPCAPPSRCSTWRSGRRRRSS